MPLSKELAAQLDDLQQKIDRVRKEDSEDNKFFLRIASLEVSKSLEHPLQTFDDVLTESLFPAVVITAINGGLFQTIADASGPLSTDQIAQKTGCSKDLVVRLLRVLAAKGVVTETAPLTYQANDKSRFFTRKAVANYMSRIFKIRAEAYLEIPQWVKNNNNSTPPDHTNSPFYLRHHGTLWDLLNKNADDQAAFEGYMDMVYGPHLTQASADIIHKAIPSELQAKSESVAFVDIGGSSGAFAKAVGQLSSPDARIVTQDRNVVPIDKSANPNVESVEYDFYTPQNIKGARAYSLRHVLHDWSDADCKKILKSTVAGMTKGYSSLFIFEMILPHVECDPPSAYVDILMLSESGGRERTLPDWTELLRAVGLELVRSDVVDMKAGEWVIEARLI